MLMKPAELEDFLRGAFPELDMTRFTVEEATAEHVRLRLAITKRDERPGGTLRGPTLMELTDVAAYLCVLAPLGPVALAVTTSLTIHFLRKPRLHDLTASARALKRGRKLCVVEVLLHTVGEDEPVGHATVTYALPSAGAPLAEA